MPDAAALTFSTVLAQEYTALHREDAAMPFLSPPTDAFEVDDIRDVPALLRRLRPALASTGTPGSVDEYIGRLIATRAPATGAALDAATPTNGAIDEPACRAAFANAFNQILAQPLDPHYLHEVGADPVIAGATGERRNRLIVERVYRGAVRTVEDRAVERIYARVHSRQHAALCFSGGGIRSATFALGVTQGLARAGLLDKFDYLSTVSGGGYIGGWLSAWMAHTSRDEVIRQLRGGDPSSDLPEPPAVQHLRDYANYLSPRSGLLAADTWTLLATYIRNVLLNWFLLIPVLALALLLPRFAVAVLGITNDWREPIQRLIVGGLAAVGIVCGIRAVAFAHTFRPPPPTVAADVRRRHDRQLVGTLRDQKAFLWKCLLFIVVCATCLSTAWYWLTHWHPLVERWDDLSWPRQGLFFVAAGGLVHTLGWFVASRTTRPAAEVAREFLAVVVTGGLVGALAYLAALGVNWASTAVSGLGLPSEIYATIAWPAFVGLILLGGFLYIGWVSRERTADDSSREWSARFSAWLLIAIVVWLAISVLVLAVPHAAWDWLHVRTTALVGLVSGWLTARLGWSAKTPSGPTKAKKGDEAPSPMGAVAGASLAIVASVFAATLVVLLSALDAALIDGACTLLRPTRWSCGPAATSQFPNPLDAAANASFAAVTAVAVVLVVLLLIAKFRIDPNKFSLQGMYRSRLIRAYLGASRQSAMRDPDPFTKFDENDNLHMHQLWPATDPTCERHPPLHVLNLALNLVTGEKLAWQERKAESFSVSPLHAGSKPVGYRPTSYVAPGPTPPDPAQTAGKLYGGDNGITLGTAVALSGAAASPNMGYHSSPAITFVMTLFNGRLGAWLGNPGPAGEATFARSYPRNPLKTILDEMFGFTTDRNENVYLSDGGHFDNLGLYEMVLRRCRCIVVVDAGEDGECTFADLGDAIRKIRIDHGIPIEFDRPIEIYPRTDTAHAPTGRYGAVGTIRYSCVDKRPGSGSQLDSAYDGTIIYIKPALYGTEPRDVYEYGARSTAFPHESTVDQFFSESQFESYRALGSHTVDVICRASPGADPAFDPGTLAWFADRMRKYEPLEATKCK